MDVFARRPTEPEEADGDAEGADEGGRETLFWCDISVLVEFGLGVFVEVVEERGAGKQLSAHCRDRWGSGVAKERKGGLHCDESANEDTEESEAALAEVEFVDPVEDNGEGFEPDVEEAVHECNVQVQ